MIKPTGVHLPHEAFMFMNSSFAKFDLYVLYSPSLKAVSYWHRHEMLFVIALLSASTLEAISQLLNIISRQFNAYFACGSAKLAHQGMNQ